jgi:hypothetical protein
MMLMRIRYRKLGGHYHCRVFTSPYQGAVFSKCGDLCFSEDEWEAVRRIIRAEFVNDDDS